MTERKLAGKRLTLVDGREGVIESEILYRPLTGLYVMALLDGARRPVRVPDRKIGTIQS